MNREIKIKKVGRQKKLTNPCPVIKGVIEDDINLGKFTQEEEAILRLTEEIWNRFLELPINHPMEKDEMAIKIHDIQRMIISRPGFRLNV